MTRSPLVRAAALVTRPFTVLALVHLTVLAWRLPLFDRLPGWVFVTHPKPMSAVWWAALAGIPAATFIAAHAARRRRWVLLLALVVGGTAFQQALAWSEGRGLDGMRERIVRSGHAELADAAVSQRSLWLVASRYEQKVQGGELGRYAHSKPPGTLLAYMATERLSRPFAQSETAEARRQALNTVAALLWPFLSYLVLVPLYIVVARLATPGTALLACASYMVVPSTALITLHTDQFLFPLLGMIGVWAGQEAAVRRSLPVAVATGVWIWCTGFFTFPLLLLAPLVAAVMWGTREASAARGGELPLRRLLLLMAGVAAGAVLGFMLFRWVFAYDAFARLADARQFNAVWKGWDGGAFQTLYFAWMNLLEFALWVGLPLVLLAAGRCGRALRQAAAGEWRGLVAPALALAGVVVYVAFFGQSKGETARLWLFLVPVFSALAADELVASGDVPLSAPALLTLQWITVVLTKTGQDFF